SVNLPWYYLMLYKLSLGLILSLPLPAYVILIKQINVKQKILYILIPKNKEKASILTMDSLYPNTFNSHYLEKWYLLHPFNKGSQYLLGDNYISLDCKTYKVINFSELTKYQFYVEQVTLKDNN
ncbi:hypothetical protein NW801_13930, partial [Brevibacillus laterosporus]